MRGCILTCLFGVFLIYSWCLGAATITVQNLNNTGQGSLRQAIADAKPGDTIKFKKTLSGIITAGEGIHSPSTFDIDKTLTIDATSANITISGASYDPDVVLRIDSNAVVTIKGLAITNGYGGIINFGTLMLSNCNIHDNDRAKSDGGGIVNVEGGLLTIINNTKIYRNHAGCKGGGIYNESGGQMFIFGSDISGNLGDEKGGGICNLGQASIDLKTTIQHNGSIGDGGGILNDAGGKISISGLTTISGNQGWDGGGIYNASGTVTLNNSIITQNIAKDQCQPPKNPHNGGGIYNVGILNVDNNSQITGNIAGNYGGGIYNDNVATLKIDSSSSIVNNKPDNIYPRTKQEHI